MVRPQARHGRGRRFFEAIAKTGPVTEFTPLAYASNDDGDVMVFIRYAFTVTANGKLVAMNMHHYWKEVPRREGTTFVVPRTQRRSPRP